MFKKLLILPFIAVVLILAGCEAQKSSSVEAAIAEAKAAASLTRTNSKAKFRSIILSTLLIKAINTQCPKNFENSRVL